MKNHFFILLVVFIFLMGTMCGVSAESAQRGNDYQAFTLEELLALRDAKYRELELINQAISLKNSKMEKNVDNTYPQQTDMSTDEKKYEGLKTKGNYQYSWDADGNIKLVKFYWTGINFKKGDDIVIPDFIDGHPVVVIGTQCFSGKGSKDIGTLVIPDTVTTIEYQAIYELTINHISLPQSVTKISHGAFVANFKSISMNGKNSKYTVVDNALYEKESKTLIAVSHTGTTIPNGIETIGAYACYLVEPEDRKMSTIPESVKNIEEYAFFKAKIMIDSSAKSFHIPAINIGNYAFSKCWFWGNSVSEIDLTFNLALSSLPVYCFSEASTKSLKRVKYWNSSRFEYEYADEYYNCTCNLFLPDNLVMIGDFAFNSFSNSLNRFDGDEYGTIEIKYGFPLNLSSIGDHCFDRQGKIVICSAYAFEKNERLTSFGSFAFSNATLNIADQKLNDLTFICPPNLYSIGESAFNIKNDSDFYTFQLPASTALIGKDAFDKTKVILMVEPNTYSEKWASDNAYRYKSSQEEDLSWLE